MNHKIKIVNYIITKHNILFWTINLLKITKKWIKIDSTVKRQKITSKNYIKKLNMENYTKILTIFIYTKDLLKNNWGNKNVRVKKVEVIG